MTIILLGYMGSGKSTLGRKLAESLNIPFIDLDDYIEEKEGLSISELFAQKGEIYFRKKEHEHLKAILENQSDVVLALGGGTPCYANNMELIKTYPKTKSVYFKASIGELVKRLKHERAKRPILSRFESEDDLTEFIGKHLFERVPFYSQADVTLEVSNTTELAILDALMQALA
ncbi:shikimate kinase [Formosa sp. S-31]|uniref:shikimate kinase n=1 Tax=Formosa sp. S-31 TaxID=2790949 RepID=UPI003EB90FB4